MAPPHLSRHQKKAQTSGAALIFEDEASFRQDSTLHCTWSRRGCQPVVPVTGARKNIKIFGCVEINTSRFLYRRDTVFNACTYLDFLGRIAQRYYPRRVFYIQDNASYHKDKEVWAWFSENRHWWQVYNLPPYSPEFNAVEPLWHHTRISGTHNRYFIDEAELWNTLTRVFRSMQRRPQQIEGYLRPFL
jgi:transposase